MTRSSTSYFTLAIILLLPIAGSARAQDSDDDEELPLNEWVQDAIGKFSFTQAAYNNWNEGGLNTLALTAGIDYEARHRSAHWKQVHEIRLAYGIIRQDTLDVRKADDAIRLASRLQYQGEDFFHKFNPTVAAKLRTQFAPGYNYDEVPDALPSDFDETPVKVSDFFSPAVFKESIGLTYDPDAWFSQRLGVGLKETVVLIERLRPLYYGPDSEQLDQPIRFEAGFESHTEVDRELVENVRLKSSLNAFYAYNQLEEPPDVLWENIVSMGINNWLSVNFEGTMLFDQNIDDRPQLKEILSIGISYALI